MRFFVPFLAAFLCFRATAQEKPAALEHPHLILFLVDDMGWQDSSLSLTPSPSSPLRHYRTPHLEKLAANGMRFSRAYAHSVCSPSRIAILTGKNSARHRVTNWTHPDGLENGNRDGSPLASPKDWRRHGIDPAETTLPSLLRKQGYTTLIVGKGHFGSKDRFGADPKNLGFETSVAASEIGQPGSYFARDHFGKNRWHVPDLERWHGSDLFLSEVLTREFRERFDTARASSKPVFAWMAHYAVHAPFQADPRYAKNDPDLTPPQRAYATLIEGMDRSLGDILEYLEQRGIARQTLIVFASDNGGDAPFPNPPAAPIVSGNAPLRGKKGMAYEGGIRVPLVISWAHPDPDEPLQRKFPVRPHSTSSDLVTLADLFATFLDAAGAPAAPKPSPDSYSLAPYLQGKKGTHRPQRWITHYPHSHNQSHFTVLHDQQWKLIRFGLTGKRELYHLADDLSESRDLSTREPARLEAMTRAMDASLDEMKALRSESVSGR